MSAKLQELLQAVAKTKKLNQSLLAKKTGLSRVTINHFFNGKADIKTNSLLKIMEALSIDLEGYVESHDTLKGYSKNLDHQSEDIIKLLGQADYVTKRTFHQALQTAIAMKEY